MRDGYIILKQAFSPQKASEWSKDLWTRLGMVPNDKSTWYKERVHMPHHKSETVKSFAPDAWSAMCDLLGGEERIDPSSAYWNDAFIVNLGKKEYEDFEEEKVNDPYQLDNWHIDGDFFVHFLDSPEQALLVIPLFSKIKPRGGGTMIAPDGIQLIARYLYSHPEGVIQTPQSLTPATSPYLFDNAPPDPRYKAESGYHSHLKHIHECNQFVEMTGEIGDVILLHPLMLHSFAPNLTRELRVITNPPVALKEPFRFSRRDGTAYSLVERKTLDALGVGAEGLVDWEIKGERRRVVPERVRIQERMLEEERRRLELVAQKDSEAQAQGFIGNIQVVQDQSVMASTTVF